MPMGGWAEEGQTAPRHHEPLPEESSDDEMPPHIHKVNAVCDSNDDINVHMCSATATKWCFLFFFSHFRLHSKAM